MRVCFWCRRRISSSAALYCKEHAKRVAQGENPYKGRDSVVNESVARSRFFRTAIDKGVTGKDLIQPLNREGNPNYDFVEHYGTKSYTPSDREWIKKHYG